MCASVFDLRSVSSYNPCSYSEVSSGLEKYSASSNLVMNVTFNPSDSRGKSKRLRLATFGMYDVANLKNRIFTPKIWWITGRPF